MRIKRAVVNTAIRTFYHLKNLGALFFVPLLVIDGLMPLLGCLVYSQYGAGERFYAAILEFGQYMLPFASVWWSLFVLRDYLEGDGAEVLYANAHNDKFVDIFLLFAVSCVNIAITFAGYAAVLPEVARELIRIWSVCILYFGIIYFVGFLSKSTTGALLLVLLYTIANIFYGRIKGNALFLYFSLTPLNKSLYWSSYAPLLLLGIGLTAAGIVLNRTKFKLYTQM